MRTDAIINITEKINKRKLSNLPVSPFFILLIKLTNDHTHRINIGIIGIPPKIIAISPTFVFATNANKRTNAIIGTSKIYTINILNFLPYFEYT
jgi:hypothetical protein